MKEELPNRELVEFLFGERAYLPRGRFYITNSSRQIPQHERHVSMTVLTADEKVVAGISVQLAGLEFAFLQAGGKYGPAENAMNRPAELVVATAAGLRRIALSWEHGGSGELVIMEQRPVAFQGRTGAVSADGLGAAP